MSMEANKFLRGLPQKLAALAAAGFGVCAGAVDGWAAAAFLYLQQSDDTVPGITYLEASWIVSLSHLGSLFGAIPAGYLANMLGRRRLMLFMAVPMFVSWLMILSGHNYIPVLYTARFIQGFSVGVVTVAYSLYCDEIAELRLRDKMGTYFGAFVSIGLAYVSFGGCTSSYIEMTISCTILPIMFAVVLYWMPESPLYLLAKGQTDKAKESLRWLRRVGTGQSAKIEGELNEIEKFINKLTDRKSFSSFTRSLFENSEAVQYMKIVFGPMVFRQVFGLVVLVYGVYVFQKASRLWDPILFTVIFAAVQCVLALITYYICAYIVDRDRTITSPTFSGAGMGVCLLVATFHFLINPGTEIIYFEWLPLIAVYKYIFNFLVGIGPAPWFMMSIILCKEDRDWVISLGVCLNSAKAFFVTKFFPIIMNEFGFETSYVTLAFICLVGNRMNSRWFEVWA